MNNKITSIFKVAAITFMLSSINTFSCPSPGSPPCPPTGTTIGCSPREGCTVTAHDSLVGSVDCDPIVSLEPTGTTYPIPCTTMDGQPGHIVYRVMDVYITQQSYKTGKCWYDDDTANCKTCTDKSTVIWKSVSYGSRSYQGQCPLVVGGMCEVGRVA
jgi:hypothetical protein